MRLALSTALLTFALAAPLALAQEAKLPDIGSSAGELLTPAKQAEYGAMMLRELRNYGYLLDDPLIDNWLNTVGDQLAADSDKPEQPFTFFMLKDRQINAFATLGGYIAMNAGLVLTAEEEDEVAAVLSHEIAHVTQQHVLRGAERAQRDQLPILLGMLAAIVAAQAAGGNSTGDATMAAISSGMGLMQQAQINYTRSNEAEADRIGIHTLARAGYDVDAMAGFFGRMSQALRANSSSGRERTPDYLQTHPVTTTRISEAHQRAEQIRRSEEGNIRVTTTTPEASSSQQIPRKPDYSQGGGGTSNPLLPLSIRLPVDASVGKGNTGQFAWAKERLRVLSATSPDIALREYRSLRDNSGRSLSPAERYGVALAHLQGNSPAQAAAELQPLLAADPDNLWLALALGQAESRSGRSAAANRRFAELLQHHPDNRAIALTYADALNQQGTREAGQQAQAVLRPLLSSAAGDPVFQRAFARANELAGDAIRAGEAYAETAYLNGRAEQALIQLQNLKKRDDLDYYARARIDARIAAITPEVLELRRQGIRDPDLERR
ncbi:M48 family metalloprotease [Pseudoxanthomonas kalamensis]|uniref:M48 family metalloprotease n=1 Tax=Pseudoxanthomonas kalamensis TaxID=289483 RepID=UPI001FEA19B8|nr:M48 family metalloprotease [Pseudoxanthomonas kalamensis]